jgi:hypothetical protein
VRYVICKKKCLTTDSRGRTILDVSLRSLTNLHKDEIGPKEKAILLMGPNKSETCERNCGKTFDHSVASRVECYGTGRFAVCRQQ